MSWNSPDCSLCKDLGILELIQAQTKTVAKCMCSCGKNLPNQIWKLPTIPLENWETKPFEAWQFNPTYERNYNQTISWWKEKIKMAEEFWASQIVPFGKQK